GGEHHAQSAGPRYLSGQAGRRMMLDVQGLRTGYGRIPILNGVSFCVNEGEFIGILGHNGMGKTTLLKALMGFLPATAGRVLLGRAGAALSGGEQQLLAIARCLCGNPRLVLLDEPTEGIQPSIIDEIIETLQRLRAESGLTMILVEQNLDFIAALSQRILIIQKGAITREVAPAELGDPGLVGEFVGIAT